MTAAYAGPAVVLGHSGFIGRPLTASLRERSAEVHGFSSRELDLRNPSAFAALDRLLSSNTTLFVCAALTPDRGASIETSVDHIGMMANLATYLSRQTLRKCVFVSSDAVYPMIDRPVDEETPVAPTGAYPVAKYTAERLLEMAVKPLLIVRPTAVFGPGDPHNSYGPNRFVRTAVADHVVRLFGQGEELRDHLFVDDLVRILTELGALETAGVLNIATGQSRTFGSIVDVLRRLVREPFEVVNAPRGGPVTHRRFDIARLNSVLPSFTFTPFEEALRKTVSAALTTAVA